MKKLIAILMAAMLLLSCAGCGKSASKKAEGTDGDAFTQVVQTAINQYGIVDKNKSENSYDWEANPFTGVMAAERIDVTGDGEDELFLMYFNKEIHMEVYEMEKKQAVKKWSDTHGWGGIFYINMYDTPDGPYWSWNASRHWPSDMITYKDGKYISAWEMGDFTEEEIARYRNGEYFSSMREEGDAYYKIFADRLNLDISQIEYGSENHLYNYHIEGTMHPIDEEEFLSKWDVKIPKARISPLQALGKIKYYGDPKICKMTKEMAQAYADAIEEEKNHVNSRQWDTDMTVYSVLMDLADDGMPLLITIVANGAGDEAWEENRESLNIWTWNGEKAEKYDFISDTEMGSIFGYNFYPKGRKGADIIIGDGLAQSVGEASGDIYYTVSNAQLKKVRHDMSYSAYVHDGVADGQRLPGVNAQKIEYGERATEAELIAAGWMGEKDNQGVYSSLNAYYVDGKMIKHKNEEEYQKFLEEHYSGYIEDNHNRYMIYEASTGLSGITPDDWTKCDDAKEALSYYIDSVGKPCYSSYIDVKVALTDAQVKALADEAAKKFNGTVGEIFKLSDDLYYVTIYVDGEFVGGTVVKNITNGEEWTIVESSKEVMSEEALARVVTKDNSVSNIVIDYEETKNAEKYLNKVFENIDGTTPNNAAKEELADYAQKYIAQNSEGKVKAKDNCIVIDEKTIGKASENAADAKKDIDTILEEHKVELNKKVTVILRIVCRNMKSDAPMQITFDASCLEGIKEADALYVELCRGYGVKVSKDALQSLISQYGKITVTITKNEDGSCNIQFADAEGNVLQQLPVSISFTLPAENELCTVYAQYTGGTDNWGGQFDETKKEISFETPYTGTYTVTEEKSDISDIAELSDEHQRAIRFMVSKGYFALNEGSFNPNGTLTRYAFSEALVRMFFILDRSMTTSLTDVPADSPYYAYVASGENAKIIEGYDDNTFRGDKDVLRQEVLALCSRTLRERKGYIEPTSPYDFLHFTDNDKIAEWAKSEIALAVRETLISDGGILSPDTAITRADSALLLYRLFMLLYEVEPVAVKDVSSGSATGWIVGTSAAVVVLGAGAAAAGIILKKKKGSIASGEAEDASEDTVEDTPEEATEENDKTEETE